MTWPCCVGNVTGSSTYGGRSDSRLSQAELLVVQPALSARDVRQSTAFALQLRLPRTRRRHPGGKQVISPYALLDAFSAAT